MGSSYLFGYTEKKAVAKARKRKITLVEYLNYLQEKQKNRGKKVKS